MGLVVFPYAFVFEFLAPIIELGGLISLIILIVINKINWEMALIVLLYSYCFAVMISILVIIWDNFVFKYYKSTREVLQLAVVSVFEPFFYHPMIVFFGIRGYFKFLTSKKLAWGTMTRKGVKNVT